MKHFFTTILATLFLCSPAVQPDISLPDYLITEITISCNQDSPAPRQFTDQQSMGKILQYLRSVPLYGEVNADSMNANDPLYTVTLTHASGRVTVYRQTGLTFLQKDGSPWYRINSEQENALVFIYENLPDL